MFRLTRERNDLKSGCIKTKPPDSRRAKRPSLTKTRMPLLQLYSGSTARSSTGLLSKYLWRRDKTLGEEIKAAEVAVSAEVAAAAAGAGAAEEGEEEEAGVVVVVAAAAEAGATGTATGAALTLVAGIQTSLGEEIATGAMNKNLEVEMVNKLISFMFF